MRHWSTATLGLLASMACGAPPPIAPPDSARIDPPAAPGALAPNWAREGDSLLLSWLEPDGLGHALRFARLDPAGRWGPVGTVTAGGNLFVNWADFPSLAKAGSGDLVAHWLEKSGADAYAYDVQLARSTDGGGTWSHLGPAHDDGVRAEHGFVSLLAGPEGVRAFWLDGRHMDGGEAGHGQGPGARGAMSMRTAFLDRQGKPVSGVELDDRVCDCCQTSAALTADGPVVVYRDRSEREIRDISIIRSAGGGWTRPAPVHRDGWEVPGCPVNGPAVASGGPGSRALAVAWFTAEANRPRVQVAFSEDAGRTFGAPTQVDATEPLGRVGLTLGGGGEAIVSWLAGGDGERAEVRIRRVSPDGRLGAPFTMASTTRSRAGGFPRMARLGAGLALAWTETGEPSHVRAAKVPISALPAPAGGGIETPSRARTWDRRPGSRPPGYAARTPEGEPISLAGLRGQAVLLNLWATWCAPCRDELPILISLHDRYAGQGLRLLGVSVDVDLTPAQVRAFADRAKIPYTILHDAEDRASTLFVGQPILPASFLFDRQGVLVWSRVGVIWQDDPELAAAISKALAAAPG
jgi:thiol-disulfide isomerase/thioredoxin